MNGNNINETLFMLDDIRAGLQSLNDEEENLIILKSHLAKIKKIREDQIRKDELVSTLKDRINVLENELSISNRQSFELQEILSERILTLENSLKDRNDLELSCYELTERIESLVVQKGLSDADLEFERNKNHDHRASHATKDQEILSLKTALQSDQQVIVQMQTYFESLKTELNNKEQVITVHSKKHKDIVVALKNELAVSKQTVSDMAGQLVKADEARLKQNDEAAATRQEIEQLRAEGTARRVELEQWKTMYQELEAVVLAVKTQLSTTQEGLGQELTTLREELSASRRDTKDSRVELRDVHHTLASITHDMDIITSFEQQKGSSTVRSTTQRAEILALALSMQRSIASLGLTNGDDHAQSSTFAHINRDMQRIVAFMSDLVHRLVAQQEEGAALGQQLHQRSEAVTSASTLMSRYEDKYSGAKQELAAIDEAVKGAVMSLLHCFPSVGRDGGLVTRSNQSFLQAKRGSPSKREDTQRRTDKLESRAFLLDQLTQLVESTRVTVTETIPSLRNELSALRARGADELRAMEERHEATLRRLQDANHLQEQNLRNEIQTLRQENEEALVAVETVTWESQNEIKRLKAQCKARLGEDQLGLAAENSGLHSSLRTCNERYQSVTLSLEHVLHHVTPLVDRYRTLQAAYRLLYRNWFYRADQLVDGVQALSECCGVIDDSIGLPNEEHVIHGKVSTTRPSASSRDQRLRHLREQQHLGETPTKDNKTHRQSRPCNSITLRVVGLLVLAANRFLRHRYSRHIALDDQTNLVAVSTAREAGLSGCAEASFQSHFLVCYPAFDLPALEILLSESSRIVTEQLLQAASAQRADNGAFSSYGGQSLLDVVKANSHIRNRGNDLLCARDIERVQLTLLETCSRVRRCRDEESKAEAIINALQSQVGDLEESLRSALATEQSQQTRIDTLEKERRFGSLTILRDIHNELKEHEADVKQHNERNSKPNGSRPASAPVINKQPVAHYSSGERNKLASSSGSRGYETVLPERLNTSDDRRDEGDDEDEDEDEEKDYSRELREAMGSTDDLQRSSGSLHFQSRQISEEPLWSRQTSNSRYGEQSHSSSGEVYRAVKATRSSRFRNYSEYVAERDVASKQRVGRSHTTLRDDDRFDQCAAQVRNMILDSSRSLSEAEALDRSFDALNTTANTFDSSDLTRTRMDDSGYSSSGSYTHAQVRSHSLPSSAEKDRRSARLAANQSRDDDILEIYSDIGRLTGRLESRLRTSSNASPEQQQR